MKKIALALAALFALCASAFAQVNIPPGPPIQCTSSVVYDASTSGSTELVQLRAGRSIYVCGYAILGSGTVNVKLIYGTGTACATGSQNLTPAYQLIAQAGIADVSPFVRGMITPLSQALCINTNGAVAVGAIVYYGQY